MNQTIMKSVKPVVLSILASSIPVYSFAYDVGSLINAASTIANELKNHPNYKAASDSIGAMITGSEMQDADAAAAPTTGLVQYDLGAYKAFLDCNDKTASIVWREERVDTGNVDRYDRFFLNKQIPKSCQPLSTGTYKWKGKPSYHRGHLLGANGFDYSNEAMYQANYMINVVPQISTNNTSGLWRDLEKRVECMRTPEFIGAGKSLTTIAGVIWGDDPFDDHFFDSHGQNTPSKLFKILIAKTPTGSKSYAWVFSNTEVETKNLNSLLVSPEYIERLTGYTQLRQIVPEEAYSQVAARSPAMISGCDLS